MNISSNRSNPNNEENNRSARERAMQAAAAVALEPTSLLEYQSRGRLLIIGPSDVALGAAARLGSELQIGIVAGDAGSSDRDKSYPSVTVGAAQLHLSGHLGAYQLDLLRDDQAIPVAPLLGWPQAQVDLILDLGTTPLLDYEISPFGYFATRAEPAALEQALAELPELVGEFEKVKYFAYDPDICAHGSSKLSGCRRCLDACPTGAITSLVDKIQVDPYYCQGAGGCATACPTGAITYRYPPAADTLNRLRVLLRTYLQEGGQQPLLLFHDGEFGQQLLLSAQEQLPAHVLAVAVEEIGSVGMDIWLSALAFGASRIVLLDTVQVAQRVRQELNDQLASAQALLDGCGYPPAVLSLIQPDTVQQLLDELAQGPFLPPLRPATFSGSNEKRNMLFFAIDWLLSQAGALPETIKLPPQAPFGHIIVERSACTLCMACVAVCPASAVAAGGDTPRLDFIEANCVQCGLCEQACPEDAIRLEARYLVARGQRQQRQILNEEAPFYCISCGQPFATQSVIQKMTAKLTGHWMFQDGKALRRLQMCGDCRVRNMFEQEQQQGKN